jgi:hypothetical protein
MSGRGPLRRLDPGRSGEQFYLVDYPIQSDGLTASHGSPCRLMGMLPYCSDRSWRGGTPRLRQARSDVSVQTRIQSFPDLPRRTIALARRAQAPVAPNHRTWLQPVAAAAQTLARFA